MVGGVVRSWRDSAADHGKEIMVISKCGYASVSQHPLL